MKTAIVTGAAKGIGAAVAERLCRDGFSVGINYLRSEEKAKQLIGRLLKEGFDAFPVQGDVSVPKVANEITDTVFDRNGRLDVLVNNAGIAVRSFFDETSDSDWKHLINANLTSVFNCSRAAAQYMLHSKSGKIINISSMWGQTGASMEVAYSASKAGVIGLTKALAKELAPSGITVNCICPGVIDTDMTACFSDDERKLITEDIPLGRFGTPEDIANAVSFFSSEQSSYITGQILGVNGGTVI